MLTMDGRPVWFTTPTVPLLRPGIGKQPNLKRGIGHLGTRTGRLAFANPSPS